MSSLYDNFVKCAYIRCDEYVQHKSPKETPLCDFHGTYDTTDTVTSAEMVEIYNNTEQAFYARCENLKERVAELTADKMNHGKMRRWNKKFEMCSKCDNVITCTYFTPFLISNAHFTGQK
jgi:hypothetical protein